jgi:hypothetical protein
MLQIVMSSSPSFAASYALQELKIPDAFRLRELPLAILPLRCACQ